VLGVVFLRFEFVVVGSGIAGLSTAYMLSERGYDVALVGLPELMRIVGGSSSGILTYHMPPPFIDWSLETLDFYLRLGEGVVERTLCLWMSRDRGFVEAVSSRVRERGVRVRRASEGYLRDLGLDIVFLDDEVVTLGDGFRINVGRLVEALSSKLESMGVRIVKGWGELEGGSVRVGGEVIRGNTIIVAAGAWSREILGLHNTIIYKCQAVRLEEPRVEYMVIDDSIGFYMNKMQDNTVALGDGIKVVTGTPEEALKADKWVVEEVIGRARRRGIIAGYKIAYTVSAPCIGTGDAYPLVGKVTDNVYTITALNGVGFSIAPALARMLVDHLTKGARIPEQLNPRREIPVGEPREPID
jgi:glycine/D-amino acid oxidase-like deaminating enzyme